MILGEPGTLVPGSKIQREREAIAELSLFSFADFVRDPERFSASSEVIGGASGSVTLLVSLASLPPFISLRPLRSLRLKNYTTSLPSLKYSPDPL